LRKLILRFSSHVSMTCHSIARLIYASFLLGFCLTATGFGQAVLPYGLKTRPDVGPYFDGKVSSVPSQAAVPLSMKPVNAFPNLTFQNPMGISQMPGTDWMVVWEREGTVRSFVKDAASATTNLLLDVSSRCQGWDDCGLLALVFHPNFSLTNATHRHVYLWYTYNPPGLVKGSALARPAGTPYVTCYNRLSRFNMDEEGVILPETELVMIHQKCKTVWHKGSGMFFHPTDGFLYITVGEDFDAKTNTQLVNRSLFGGVLRIDVNMTGGIVSHPIPRQPYNPPTAPGESYTANYYIPNDNPLVGEPNVLEEFYVIGLRSPDEMTLDPVTGRIYISDVGDWGIRGREEINVIEPGEVESQGLLNFEWDKLVGTHTVLAADQDHQLSGRLYANSVTKPPLLEYAHGPLLENSGTAGGAIMGGYVYRGTEQATLLGGKYVFADNMSGRIWTLDESGPTATKTLIANLANGPGANRGQNYLGISSFGLDAAGEMYLCRMSNEGGHIMKLVPNTALQQTLPEKLSTTGLFSSLLYRTPSSKLMPYTLNQPFWSDGALKYRWMAIPTDTTLGFSPTGEWTFPAGSVFVKHFDLPISDVTPTSVRRLETRVLVKTAAGIYGGTYKWQTDKKNASLVENTTFEDIKISIRSVGTLAGYNLGGTTVPAGTSSQSSTKLTIHGAGTGLGSTADQARFNYTKRKGDFDFFVRVENLYASVGGTAANARVGIVMRQKFDANSPAVGLSVGVTTDPVNKEVTDFRFHTRTSAGGPMVDSPPSVPVSAAYPQVWLRLQRTGHLFIAYTSRNSIDWEEIGRTIQVYPATTDLLWGVTCSSQESAKRAAAIVHLQTNRTQRWTFPGQSACNVCHTATAGWVLGLNTRQLNCTQKYAATKVTDNQLRALNKVGYFTPAVGESAIPTFSKLSSLTNTTSSREDRARSYIDSNCAYCHRPGGVQALWDGRWDTPLVNQGILNANPLRDLGISGAKLIAPADVDHSLIHLRTNALGGHQMPPIGKNRIDKVGVKLLEDWINSLPVAP